jgi:Zn-dependent M28 family amino/carboxypeptidase
MGARTFTLFFLPAIFISLTAAAQKKADQKLMKQLQADVRYLASDELEGRRTGTEGERKAALYLQKRYADAGIPPYKNQYCHPFHFTYGKEIASSTKITLNGIALQTEEEAFPLPFSASKTVTGDILPDIQEQGNIWLLPLYTGQDQASDAHFDAEKVMYDRAKDAEKQGASGVIFFDSYGSRYETSFDRHSKNEAISIPVIYVSNRGYQKVTADKKDGISADINVAINKAERTGNNIAAYIDHGAKYTVILGAHYDHLGYGEDANSLYANAKKSHLIHHGADDNASGTAALLGIAEWIKKNKKLHHYNYLFVNFSAEELGLYGSKAFIKDEGIDSAHIAYMINMDMIGRLDTGRTLTLGGVGTSTAWADVAAMGSDNFRLIIDSSGVGPSDHTSFYYANIPVLFFFTGAHKDYHKPSDMSDFINYPGELAIIKYVTRVVADMDKQQKPAFSSTKQNPAGMARFKVTLGIMPDYTFENGGVRVDGVADGRPAMKAGIQRGDIITRIGDYKVQGMQSYMEALSKFAYGDKTKVMLLRSGKEMELTLELSK